MEPYADDLRRAADEAIALLSTLPDDSWDVKAHNLEWSCRETAAHLDDDLVAYAMQLSGSSPPQDRYVDFLESGPWREGGPRLLLYPNPAAGTVGLTACLDAAAGVLCSVVSTVPPERRGYHTFGNSDASGFAAMGTVELVLHTFDILTAHGIAYRPEDDITRRVLARLFPWERAGADQTDSAQNDSAQNGTDPTGTDPTGTDPTGTEQTRTQWTGTGRAVTEQSGTDQLDTDPWTVLLRATGRTPETRGITWRWDSSVR